MPSPRPSLAFFVFLGAFLTVCPLEAAAQTDLPLPTPGGVEGSGPQRLQPPPAPRKSTAPKEDIFSVPAPLPLPPDPSPFPSFPPLMEDRTPLEIDLRKRASTSLIPEGPNPTEDAALQLRDRVRYRELKARALVQPEVRASLGAVQNARSDAALREALRVHYSRLFSAVRSMDKSLEPLIAQREKEAMAPLQEKLPRPLSNR